MPKDVFRNTKLEKVFRVVIHGTLYGVSKGACRKIYLVSRAHEIISTAVNVLQNSHNVFLV